MRIALVNNSVSPALHLLDLTTMLHLHHHSYDNNTMLTQLNLSDIQIDNQTQPLTHFPVVLATEIGMTLQKDKYLEVEIKTKPIVLKIEEQFVYDLLAFGAEVQKYIEPANPSADKK